MASSTQWHYATADGQQRGPVDADELRRLAAGGAVSPQTLVWTDGMADWQPAGAVPALGIGNGGGGGAVAAYSPPAAAPAATIAYSSPNAGDVLFTARAMQSLVDTRPWVRLVSILMFIGVALTVLGAALTLLGAAAAGSRAGAGAGAALLLPALMNLGIGVLYFFPAMYLSRYAGRIAELTAMRREDKLEQAIDAQRSFWKFVGIMIIISILLVLVVVVLMVVLGVAASSGMGGGGGGFGTPARSPAAPF
jgi:hypothetical protein